MLCIMNGLSLFWCFTSIIFVLELYTQLSMDAKLFQCPRELLCISYCIFRKHHIIRRQQKLMTTFPLTTFSMLFSFTNLQPFFLNHQCIGQGDYIQGDKVINGVIMFSKANLSICSHTIFFSPCIYL